MVVCGLRRFIMTNRPHFLFDLLPRPMYSNTGQSSLNFRQRRISFSNQFCSTNTGSGDAAPFNGLIFAPVA